MQRWYYVHNLFMSLKLGYIINIISVYARLTALPMNVKLTFFFAVVVIFSDTVNAILKWKKDVIISGAIKFAELKHIRPEVK